MTMDAQLKAKWVEALRSDEFKQGSGQLHDRKENSYCCLGLLCRVMGADFGPAAEADEEAFSEYDYVPVIGGKVLSSGEDEELKSSVCEDLGIPDQFELIAMNDGHSGAGRPAVRKHTFAEIADHIEKNL
jgi:hypothetical protein